MLEKYHDEILSCTGCGFCKKSYHVYKFPQKESDFPKGKIMISYGLLTKELERDIEVIKILQKCTLCKRCEKDCPSLIKIADIIKAARYSTKYLLPEHEKLFKNFKEKNNILGEKNFSKKGGKIAFFMGCLTNMEMKDITISLFDKLGIDATIIGGCCGYPLEKVGKNINIDIDTKIKKEIENKEIDKLIFNCPNGMLALKEYNPVHISQFIISFNLQLKKKNERYIYHDSAFLGRYLNIYEEPRQIIKKIGDLIEFEENREMARQCGGEIEFRIAFPEEAKEFAEYLLKEAKEKKATIVTSSPHCYTHLKEYGDVIDLLQLIEESI